jgi:hypothetical protein
VSSLATWAMNHDFACAGMDARFEGEEVDCAVF